MSENGVDDEEQVERQTSYSPSSADEQKIMQNQDISDSPAADENEEDDVDVLPGTGGPDDPGDIDADPA